jgi:hypothetical protein
MTTPRGRPHKLPTEQEPEHSRDRFLNHQTSLSGHQEKKLDLVLMEQDTQPVSSTVSNIGRGLCNDHEN